MAANSQSPASERSVIAAAFAAIALFVLAWTLLHVGFYKHKQVIDTPVYQRYGNAIADGKVPYRDFAVEYPPGALPMFALPGLAEPGKNQQVSAGLGIPVQRVFCLAFALGSALAALGGALGIELLGLEPSFALEYLVYFLLVVSVGGAGSVRGTAFAALALGLCDVAGKYYVPQIGAFIIYALMILLLTLFPAGLQGRRA